MKQPRLLIAGWVTLALASGVSGEQKQEPLLELPRLVAALDLTEGVSANGWTSSA